MNPITSLSDIPAALFSEFAITDDPEKQTFTQGGHRTIVKACFAQRPGPDKPHMLVYHNHHDGYGRRHIAKLEVYRQKVETWQFNERSDVEKPAPKLSIVFYAQDFDVKEPHFSTPWQEGKGYWVEEFLQVSYGQSPSGSASVISNQNDWEFEFLLDIQKLAYELAHKVESRGHWEVEWNPNGDYSKKSANVY
jgi:hypothetical protein